jgi:hypothetical protein
VTLPFTFKKYFKAKRRIMETQIFHHAKNNLQKILQNKPKTLQDIITL